MSDQKLCPTCGTEYPLSERFCPRDGTALRSANVQADLLGAIIAERYHVMKKLGEGGMGTVYLAEHVKMGRKSALKVMNPGMNTDPDAIARFNREAANASRLNHPNVCAIYDFGETTDGLIYLAMEYIEGSSLTGLIEKDGSLPAARCGSIIHQTADALQVAHDAGIVHRDLKPDNIMIARTRDGADLVKVVDFGIAKASSSDAQKVTKTGLVVGTPEYMSPEQLAGDKLDGRSDIYSLGLVAFNCLTGALPFPAETVQEAMIMRLTDRPRTLSEVRPDVAWPAEVQRTLDKALEREAAARYQSAAQFGREFSAAIAEMPATKAAEARTMVVGAGGASPAAQVPPTRVNRASGATVPMDAVASPAPAAKPVPAPRPSAAPTAKKSPVALIAGGVGVVVVAVGLYLSGVIGGGDAGGTVAGGDDAVPATMIDSQQVASAPPETAADAGTGASEPKPFNRQVDPPSPPRQTTGGSASTPANTPSQPSISTRMAGWVRDLDVAAPREEDARRILNEIDPIFGSLQGDLLADGWFVKMQAFVTLNDRGACEAAREVVRRHSDVEKRKNAQTFLDLSSCS